MNELNILKSTIELVKEVGSFLTTVKDNVWGNEHASYDKLNETLDEIAKFFEATQSEISDYQSLEFSDSNTRQGNKKLLYDLEGGMLRVRIEAARGHCSKIKLIYENYLDKWFREVFGNSSEYNTIHTLFLELSVYDVNMFAATDELQKFIKNEAVAVLNFVEQKDYTAADEQIIASRATLSPIRQSISELLTNLLILKNKFMILSKRT